MVNSGDDRKEKATLTAQPAQEDVVKSTAATIAVLDRLQLDDGESLK